MSGIEARAARAAKIAAAAVRAGHDVSITAHTDIAALERNYGIEGGGGASAAPAAPATVSRGDAKGFVANLEGIAKGKVKVVS